MTVLSCVKARFEACKDWSFCWSVELSFGSRRSLHLVLFQVLRHTAEDRDDDSAYLYGNSIAPDPAKDQVKCPENSTEFQNNEVNKEANGNLSNSDADKMVPVADLNVDTMRDDSQNPASNFRCTACNNVTVEVHSHPLLEVIVCMDCKRLIEDRVAKVCFLPFPVLCDLQCICVWARYR